MDKRKKPGTNPVSGPHYCRGCGIFSREPICRHCRHTDRKYGTKTGGAT